MGAELVVSVVWLNVINSRAGRNTYKDLETKIAHITHEINSKQQQKQS
jgi:hypothetical protein